MMHFYTNVQVRGNKILVRGVRDGKPYRSREEFSPTLFVKTQMPTGFKTIYGDDVKPVGFDLISEARDFINQYKGVPNFPVFGQTMWQYQYIAENFKDVVAFDKDLVRVETVDIETSTEFGFPDVFNPIEEVLLISVQDNVTKEKITWGTRPCDVSKFKNTDTRKLTYVHCKDERELFAHFCQHWRINPPDVVTGWNIKFFDIPYLVERIKRQLGDRAAEDLSPFKEVKAEEVEMQGRMYRVFDIVGVATLDYLDLYKKFTYVKQETYKLDFIAKVELEKEKLKSRWETYKEFYTNDWDLFVEYNVVDVDLVDALEDKLKLIELVLTMAYDAKCNFVDVFSPVRIWDCLLYHHLSQKQVVVPQKEDSEGRKIEGAYVKEPKPGAYRWVVSFDATSLYPSIMLQYNMSPEKLATHHAFDTNVATLLEGETDLSELGPNNVCMAANGHCFSTLGQGLFTEIVARIFDERQTFKKKMLAEKQRAQDTGSKEAKKLATQYKMVQEAKKIQLNSLYGAFGNRFFRFYDDRIAEGITLTGQFVLRSVLNALNEYLNKVVGTEGVDYAFYGDTDSVYITLDLLVEKYYKDLPKEKVIDVLDKICQAKIVGEINKACARIASYTNAYDPKRIYFKREAIADNGVWVAKKRYALNVYDMEGVRLKEPELKVLGFEIVRSSTPAPVRDALKKAVNLMLTGTEKQVQEFIASFEKEFRAMDLEMIAFPRGVNGLSKYSASGTIYKKGCPMHVRASLLHNFYVKQKGLDKKYEAIYEGAKIKFVYLVEPNTIGEDAIAFMGELPKELGLHQYVDYTRMYESSFLRPLESILEPIGWTTSEVFTLEDLFA
jgi:DNA polymerase elongation subunit (family B)